MNFKNIIIIEEHLVKKVKWKNNGINYDYELYKLGKNNSKFLIINPWLKNKNLLDLIEIRSYEEKCIVWYYENNWIAKLFYKNWNIDKTYKNINIKIPKYTWEKNHDIDELIEYEDDPRSYFNFTVDQGFYEFVWYLDKQINPLDDEVWALKFIPKNKKILGIKKMGYLKIKFKVIKNYNLPSLDFNLDTIVYPFWEFQTEKVFYLSDQFKNPTWVIKISTYFRKTNKSEFAGTLDPKMQIEYNQHLPMLDYDIDYQFNVFDLKYEHIWLLDKKHYKEENIDIWAFKIKFDESATDSKIIEYISPRLYIEHNTDLPKLNHNLNYDIQYYDFKYENIFYSTKNDYIDNNIWILSIKYQNKKLDKKHVKNAIEIIPPSVLDVFFISNGELNAEKNWLRVLNKAPHAKRITDVKGIFNAHKRAAELSSTDMFYVVDGDCFLIDEWEFNFQPDVFNRTCAYVWKSKNPINNLIYHHGGVKLFPKISFLEKHTWTTLDMFTGLDLKLKFKNDLSCMHNFNTDPFSTWRSAVRECVKLYMSNQLTKLNSWSTVGKDKLYGEYAISGAKFATQFAMKNIDNKSVLLKINDYNWLKKKFNKLENKGNE